MGIHRGPNIVKDNLVFGYDTGYGVADNSTATRFYPGKPTTNLLTLSGAQSLDVRTDIYSNTTKTNLGGGKYRFVNDGTGGSTIRLYTNLNDLVNGTTYGCSVSYENFNPGDGTSILLDWCDQNNTAFSYANYGSSNRIFMTGARSTYDSTFRFLDISLPVNSAITLFDAQVELSTPSPFTDSTRSDTTSLIDLKRTADIDLSNVSFDSIGQPEFDGAGDYIDLPDSLITNLHGGTEASICIWIKNDTTVNAVSTSGIVQLSGYNSTNGCLWFYNNGYTYLDIFRASRVEQVFTNNTEVSTNWNLLTVTTTPGTNGWKCYMNGVLKKQVTGDNTVSVADIQGGLTIGRNSSSRYTNGKIAACQIYNRALTAAEVIQNYNAQKNRFNI